MCSVIRNATLAVYSENKDARMETCKTAFPSSDGNGSSLSSHGLRSDEKEEKDEPDDGATRHPVATCLTVVSKHKALEITLLSAVIVFVWGLLSLPVVFYHVSDSASSGEETSPEANGSNITVRITLH